MKEGIGGTRGTGVAARAGLLAAAVLGLALAGCGSDNHDAPTAGEAPSPAPAPAPTPAPAPARGQLNGQTPLLGLTTAQIDEVTTSTGLIALTGNARCDVQLQRLDYATIGARGETGVTATAALLVPGGANCPGPHTLVAYDHGTDVIKASSLADPSSAETQLLAAMLAAQGYAVVAPDFLGYAGSNYAFHPYLHADSEASVTVDALRAARQALAASQVSLNPGVLLTGYSQGGHASMATQRAIEADPSGEFTVVAAGHMSGPYNLLGSVQGALALLPQGTGGASVYVSFALTSLQKVYGGLYDDPAHYFKAPYATDIDTLLPGTLSTTQLFTQGKLPVALGDLITDQLVSDVANTGSALHQRLVENTLIDWTPRAGTLLCGGRRDPVVPLSNASDAQVAFAARGASVTVVDVEQVPAFAAFFPETLTSEALSQYHSQTVPPLCLMIIRDQLFAATQAGATP